MSIVLNVLDHLDRPGTDIAIVGIDDIHGEYATVFDFITEVQRRTPNTDYDTGFLRPRDRDQGNGDKIILMSNPARITEHNVLDTRIYIVQQTNDLKPELIKYRIDT